MGKIIQITSAGNNGGMTLCALCEDGSVWEFCVQTGWIKLPLPIPSPNSEYMSALEAIIKEGGCNEENI